MDFGGLRLRLASRLSLTGLKSSSSQKTLQPEFFYALEQIAVIIITIAKITENMPVIPK